MSEAVASAGPLEGIRVFDLSHALAGPYCTMLLGDLGADVLKIEPPRGDHARSWGPPFLNGESSYFMSVNRNKRSVVLNLRTEPGRAAAAALAATCDVVVENFKPGVAARLGLGHEQLRAARPGLVYASISGYGQDHPELAGYDQIAQGTSGLMSLTGTVGGPPTKVGVPVGDVGAGMFAANAILAALLGRARTGSGAYIDVGLNDSLLALLTYQAARLFVLGRPPAPEGNFHSTIAPYGTFATADGFVNIAVGSDDQYRRFCEVLGAPELADDDRFRSNAARQGRRDELNAEIEARLGQRPRSEWLAALEAAGIPAGPILDLAEAFANPVAAARGVKVEIEHPKAGPIGQVATPWRIDGHASPVRLPPPLLGQHTRQVLHDILGYSDAESDLASAPSLGAAPTPPAGQAARD